MLNKEFTPMPAKRRAKMATIGDISIIPIGGIILRNGDKNGSTNEPKN